MQEINSMNSKLVDIAFKNKKVIIIVGIVAAALSVVFSSPTFIKPKFQSQAIIYPSNLSEYSEESPIEQMMQWFESRNIKEKIIKEFDLAKHYNIDIENDKLGMFYLLMEYDENIKVNQTKYESAEIVVQDTDPEKAYEMVGALIKSFNEVVLVEHKKRALEDLITQENQLNKIKNDLDSVSNELKKIRKDFHIINYGAQSEEVMRGYLRTFDGASKTSINSEEVIKLKDNLEEKGGEFINLDQRVYHLLEAYKTAEREYQESYKNYHRELTYTNLVSKPEVSHKKVYPVRWVIVVVSTFSAVFFAFVVILFQQRYKK